MINIFASHDSTSGDSVDLGGMQRYKFIIFKKGGSELVLDKCYGCVHEVDMFG